MSDYNKDIGKRIFNRRKEMGMSRKQLKESVGISEVYLGMIERGERGTSIAHMVKIAKALEVSMDYLILGKELKHTRIVGMNNSLDSFDQTERKLIERICRLIRINKRTGDSLKTAQDLVALYVQYEKGR